MRRVALYLRVSTLKQDEDGYSIPEQRERLVSFCKSQDWVITEIYTDAGFSGSNLDRPGMQTMIANAETGKFDTVLVYKLDRLSRSQKDTLYFIEDVLLSNKKDFVSLKESFDTSTPFGRAMVGILAVFAQLEREQIKERTMMGRVGRASSGLWHGGGTDPIGYRYINGELVVNRAEAAQVRRVFGLYASGCTLAQISERMDGYRTKHGDWRYPATVGRVLDNPLYIGTVHFEGTVVPNSHESIVSAHLFDRVQKMRARASSAATGRDSEHLLTGFVYCGDCGARYFVNKRPNGSQVYSCHSRAKKNKKMVKDPNCKNAHIPLAVMHDLVLEGLFRLSDTPSMVDVIAKEKSAALESDADFSVETALEIQKINSEIRGLMSLYNDASCSVGDVAEQIEELYKKMSLLVPSARVGGPKKNFHVEGAKLFLRDFRDAWEVASEKERRALIQRVVDRVVVMDGSVEFEWSFI